MLKSRILRTLALATVLIPLSAQAEPDLKKLAFSLQWAPQAQFGGYLFAAEEGIYRKHGLDVTILSGGPSKPDPLDLLREGKADFATLWLSAAIQARARGLNLVNIGQVVPRSALMLVAKKSRGIRNPRDVQGKKVGLWGPMFRAQPMAFFKKYDLDVTVVPQSFSVNLFLRDGVDVTSAMWYNEYHTILAAGLNPDELTTFFFHEHGLNFPEDGIYVLEDRFKRDPGACRSFVQASIEGWLAAFAQKEKTLDIVLKHLKSEHLPANRVHQRWMLDRIADLILPSGKSDLAVRLLPADYSRVAASLHAGGWIASIPEFTSFYRDCSGNGTK
ncbi:MAG TPA: ABC transporter substrate-binding protein [Thermodesulfobacteriota bacterium]|nr:ABC transporter substrate-binding protein [Thermodesulfobacteriota bacterium]